MYEVRALLLGSAVRRFWGSMHLQACQVLIWVFMACGNSSQSKHSIDTTMKQLSAGGLLPEAWVVTTGDQQWHCFTAALAVHAGYC